MIVDSQTDRLSLRAALARIDEVYRAAATTALTKRPDPGPERDFLIDAQARGTAALAALAASAPDLRLSADAQALVEAYLEGPDPDDAEGLRAWVTSVPDLMVDVARSEADRTLTATFTALDFTFFEWSAVKRIEVRVGTGLSPSGASLGAVMLAPMFSLKYFHAASWAVEPRDQRPRIRSLAATAA